MTKLLFKIKVIKIKINFTRGYNVFLTDDLKFIIKLTRDHALEKYYSCSQNIFQWATKSWTIVEFYQFFKITMRVRLCQNLVEIINTVHCNTVFQCSCYTFIRDIIFSRNQHMLHTEGPHHYKKVVRLMFFHKINPIFFFFFLCHAYPLNSSAYHHFLWICNLFYAISHQIDHLFYIISLKSRTGKG